MPRDLSVGLISDTHGLLRPEALAILKGSDFIVHAGDVGDPRILDVLATIAPVTAVRGNIDTGAWAQALPEIDVLAVGNTLIYVLHNIGELNIDPAAAGFHVVVYGHSHHPGSHEKDGVLYVNPGSAGPRRFSLPVSIGLLSIDGTRLTARIRTVEVG